MKEISLAVLEGLIHNIRTPLNLILGYAQQLQKEGNNPYLERIYQAGIKIDDMMQATWEAFESQNPQVTKVNLNDWLKRELRLLNNHLQIKHRLVFETTLPDTEVYCELSTLLLCRWLEALLLCISESRSDSPVRTSISLFEDATMQIDVKSPSINILALQQLLENDEADMQIESNLQRTDAGVKIQVKFS